MRLGWPTASQRIEGGISVFKKNEEPESLSHTKGKSSLMIFDRHANLKYNMEIGNSGAKDIM